MRVIVCDSETRSALAALRALHESGVTVIAGSHKTHAMGFYSRMCTEKLHYPNPATDREGFVAAVFAYAERIGERVAIMPFTDITADVLMRAREDGKLGLLTLVGPAYVSYERATNKEELARIARLQGIPTPRVVFFDQIERDLVTYPIIMKPTRTVAWRPGHTYKDTARVVRSKAEALATHDMFLTHTGVPPLIQEMIEGPEFGLGVYAEKGNVHTLFAYQRLRSITAHGGVSALRESIPLTDEMRMIADRLATVFMWEGVMMIELKRDVRTGALTLIEVNARFWGSLYLAIASGVNFPYLLALRAYGEPVPSLPPYRIGIRARHLLGDLMHFKALGRARWERGNLRAFCTFFQKNLFYDVWSWRDPIPGIVELLTFIKKKI